VLCRAIDARGAVAGVVEICGGREVRRVDDPSFYSTAVIGSEDIVNVNR
jgi:hypothetical protein